MKTDSENTNINLRHLRALHAIWAEGSFARAARRLGVVPSALTETVRQAEESLGGALFDRRSRPPVPTRLGLSFLRDTQSALEQFDQSLERARQQARGQAGTLRIGVTPSAISTLVAPALRQFRAQFPQISVTLHDDVAERLAAMVADGRLDLAVAGRALTSDDLVQQEIGSDAFGLVCRRDSAFTRQPAPVRLEQIDAATLIYLGRDAGSARLLAQAPELPARLRDGPLRCHSTIAQLSLVRAGIGVALLPRNAALLFNDPDLVFLPVPELDLWRRLYLITPAKRMTSAPGDGFCEALLVAARRQIIT